MLPDRAARALPLLLLGLLAGLALLLDRATNLPFFAPGMAGNEPDLKIKRFVATGFGPEGKPLYVLTADAMQHYPQDDRSELTHAKLVRTLPDQPVLNVTATEATVSESGDKIEFDKDVVMQREPAADLAAMTLTTSRLSLDTVKGLANSDAPAVMVSDGDRVQSTGFDYDHTNARLKLRSKVSINYAPPKR
ncbi:LPS export ABC transporter periplasmic protein LptC [Chitinimonas naiadis]